jgi:YD repeat-containing protein
MGRRVVLLAVAVMSALLAPQGASAQTTTAFHFHEESDDFCCRGLDRIGPDVPSAAIAESTDLKGHGTEHGGLRWFKSLENVPNWYGTFASGSTITFKLWMKKTSSWGVIYPEAGLRLNDGTGALFCQATGVAVATPPNSPSNQALTTTLAEYVFSCTTSTIVTVTSTDRLWLYAGYYVATGPGNHSVKIQLDYEGSGVSPVPDSRVIVPNPIAPPPTITAVNYTSAPPNTVVHITGTNFGTASVTRSVTFGGTPATTVVWSGTGAAVDATVPAGLAPGPSPNLISAPIKVIVQGAETSPWTFSVNPPPTLTSMTPSTAHTTDVVTITGQNFLATQAQGSSTVTFNNVTALPTSWNDTTIQVQVPSGQTTGAVVVTVAGRSVTASVPFTLIAPPVVTALYPPSAQVGAPVTIVGERFGATQSTNTIKFNGTTATPTQWTDTVIKATVPAGAATGPLVVRVSNQPSPDAAFTVLVAGGLSGTITKVTGGTAIADASVEALLGGVVKGTVTTAANGSYSISGLDPGTYDIRVFKTGFSPELRAGNLVTSSNTTTVNVAMYVPGLATGKVTRADGITPLVGAAVTVYDGPIQKGTTNTNATGDYTVSNLRPGTLTVQAANVGYHTEEQSAAIVESAATSTNFSLDGAAAGPVLYAYDALGRLVQVTDPSGDAAIYHYDPVGNITSIERTGTSVVSISGLTPTSGAVGSTVTISGTGFSTSANQNTVTFGCGANCTVAATVTSASATQLAVTVPATAVTGVSVSAQGQTANSPTSFTVTTAGGTPTISSFTPTLVVAGNTVTVGGTNFDSVTANDRVTANAASAQVTSATPTSLQATVPVTTTGRVSILTQNGTATSTDYLWVAPSPYAVSDVESTGSITLGTDTTIQVNTAGKIAMRAFDSTQGHRAAVSVTNPTGFAAGGSVAIYGLFGNPTSTGFASGGFLEPVELRATGTYTFILAPNSPYTGSATIKIYDVPPDQTGTISPESAVPVSLSVGQNARLTFTGAANGRVCAATTIPAPPDQPIASGTLKVLTPDGWPLGSTGFNVAVPAFLDTVSLPSSGTYTLFMDPETTSAGVTTALIYNVPQDISGTLSLNGSSLPVPLAACQNGSLTFNGSQNGSVTVHVTGSAFVSGGTAANVTIRLFDADTGQQISGYVTSSATFDLAPASSPTGHYKITIDPWTTSSGTLNISVSGS